MAKKNIGATLSIKDNNFTAGIRNAITGLKNLKSHTANATGGLKNMGTQGKSTGETLAGLAKKVAGVATAFCISIQLHTRPISKSDLQGK